MHIIDISEHNGAVDFRKVAQKAEGVMVRLSLGFNGDDVYRMDKRADRNIRACHRHGIPWGVYHYSYAQTVADAKSEAQGVLKILRAYQDEGIRPLLPVAFDMEDNHDLPGGDHGGASWSVLTAMCAEFCELIEQAGFYAQIYASRSWFQQMGDLSAYDHWVAEWGVSKPSIPCGLWQFTSDGNGRAYGASNPRMDENKAFVHYPTRIQEAGLNGWGTPKPKPPEASPPSLQEDIALTIGQHRWFFNAEGKLIRGETTS